MLGSRSQWPRGPRRRSAVTRLLRLRVRIPPGAWIFVCCGCCVSSGRGLCDELITRPEESYRMWYIVLCDLETSWIRKPKSALSRSVTNKSKTGNEPSSCNHFCTNFVCICSFRNPAWDAHAPYYHLILAPLYDIFPHYLIKGVFFF